MHPARVQEDVNIRILPTQRMVDVFRRVGELGIQYRHGNKNEQNYQKVFGNFLHGTSKIHDKPIFRVGGFTNHPPD